MKKIVVTRLKLVNFKGIREMELAFHAGVTNITADNGLGKSTIPDAFNWLFTGKDSFGGSDINDIKTYDKNGKHIEKIDHSAEADLLIDGHQAITLKKVLKQNWVKRRGETETVLDGHKHEYYINGVATGTETAFKEELAKIVDEKVFRLLTNPIYFNELLEWKERREILFAIAPPITDDEVIDKIATIKNKDSIATLTNILNSGADLERYKKELAARRKQKKEQLLLIPAKIEATERTKPETPDGGFAIVEHQIKKLQEEIQAIDLQLSDASQINEAALKVKREKQQFVHNLEMALQTAKQTKLTKRQEERNLILDEITAIDNKIKAEERSIQSLQTEIESNNKDIQRLTERREFAAKRGPELEARKQELLQEFNEVNARVFELHADDCKCHACDREFEGEDLEQIYAKYEAIFNKDKSDKLDQIDAIGLQIKEDIDKYDKNINEFGKQISQLEEKNLTIAGSETEFKNNILKFQEERTAADKRLADFDNALFSDSEEEVSLAAQIEAATTQEGNEPTDATAPEPNKELIEEKMAKQDELDKLKETLSKKIQIEKADTLIKEYQDDERKLAQEVADIERDEDIMQEFSRTRIESIEGRINSMFSLVNFKLFDTKLNGEEKETCETTSEGKPYRVFNTALKLNASLDIINTLSSYYGISLPIFIDNRETVSEIIPTVAQVINLIKVKGQQTLIVE